MSHSLIYVETNPQRQIITFLFSHFLQIEANDHKAFITLAIHKLIGLHITLRMALEKDGQKSFEWLECIHSLERWDLKPWYRLQHWMSDWQDANSISNSWQRDDKRQQQ